MARITLENLQPTVEYQELSGEELESVAGGFVSLALSISHLLASYAAKHLGGRSHAAEVARAMAGGR